MYEVGEVGKVFPNETLIISKLQLYQNANQIASRT